VASISVTVKVSETAEPLTVPEMTPVDAARLRPAGKMPVVTDQL